MPPAIPDDAGGGLPAFLLDALIEARFRTADPATALAALCREHPEHAAAIRAHLAAESETPDSIPLGLSSQPSAGGQAVQAIGPYRVVRRLGRGGFGEVFLAEQHEPVRRQVAIKLLKPGMDSESVLARFRQEREVLAALNHDTIAKVFDAGIAADGRPYFVMEFVEGGAPITDYCDQHALPLPARLRLFQRICQGVQHSHQRGILHRDLKPANILVQRGEGEPAIKIIDFGIAKATEQRLVDETIHTGLHMLIGTPEYAAPEQAAGEPVLDTRVDVYSLGVVLYELMTGELPFPSERLRRAANAEVLRILREEEPQRPSTRISGPPSRPEGMAVDTTAVRAQQRGLPSTAAWARTLRDDLDWIILKALAKEPDRRYATAVEFAEDVRRFLGHEPVIARRPSFGYRAQKFVRRYRVQVAAAAAVLLALVGSGTGTAIGLAQFASKVREFDQLAGVILYDRTILHEAELYPAWPGKIEAMKEWLREDCGRLLAMRSEIEQTVLNLRGQALPVTAEEIEADWRAHPRFTEWEKLSAKVGALRRAQDVRSGKVAIAEPELPAKLRGKAPGELNAMSWPLVDWDKDDRTWGQEDLALACARAAVAVATGEEKADIGNTLAWGLFFSGRDDDALAASRQALADAPEDKKGDFEAHLRKVEEQVAAVKTDGAAALAAAAQQLQALTALVGERRTWRFKQESQRFLHETLTGLLAKLESLNQKERVGVEQRLAWAQKIQSLSLAHPNARHTWAEARAAIAEADDVVASRLYAGKTINLRDDNITGLVPIGMNPRTKLWEFYELRSAWDGKENPAMIAIPEHRTDGSIKVTGATGIVLALLPGGSFLMGAQSTDPNGENYAALARPFDGPPHIVTVSPFFVARHEMTQAQWARLWTFHEREMQSYVDASSCLPANYISWADGALCLRNHGLNLPTEAQWEYACRGSMPGPIPFAWDEIPLHANVADQSCLTYHHEPWNDSFPESAPVGSFLPSNYGLYDLHGNVSEWCMDCIEPYSVVPRSGDGLRERTRWSSGTSGQRVVRGGSFGDPAVYVLTSLRSYCDAHLVHQTRGVRPLRNIESQ